MVLGVCNVDAPGRIREDALGMVELTDTTAFDAVRYPTASGHVVDANDPIVPSVCDVKVTLGSLRVAQGLDGKQEPSENGTRTLKHPTKVASASGRHARFFGLAGVCPLAMLAKAGQAMPRD